MAISYTTSFKEQAIEKTLTRADNVTVKDIADSLGVAVSTLNRWKLQSRKQSFESNHEAEYLTMKQDKRPQDWTLEERLNMIVTCSGLDDEALNEQCRIQGIYPHQVEQWKQDFISGNHSKCVSNSRSEVKELKQENRTLKKELNRKDKALAETAALLVLQKKVNAIWGNDEEN